MYRRIATPVAAAMLAALCGCDYNVPLVDKPTTEADARLVGLWERTGTQPAHERLLVLPLSPCELLVVYPLDPTNALFGAVTMAPCAGYTLAQMRWLGTAGGTTSTTNRVYQFAAWELSADELRVRLLSPQVVSRDLQRSADLAREIERQAGRADLFRPPLVFRRVKP